METLALKPYYYDQFKCTGSKCRISCCNYNWNVLIDKPTYQKYKKFNSIGKDINSDYTRKLRQAVEINPKSTNSTNYGKLRHITDEKAFILGNDAYRATECVCPFSRPDHLCDLQDKFGHDMLSLTCQIFPRNLNNIFEEYEQTLTTECEAVCELLYNIKEPIRFKKLSIELDTNSPVSKTLPKDMIIGNEVLKHFNIIRATCLKILQTRTYTMDDRIILLGLYLSKISSYKGDTLDKIPNYSKSFLLSQQEYLDYFQIKLKSETATNSKKKKNKSYYYPHKMLLQAVNFNSIELGYNEKRFLISLKNNLKVYYNNYDLLRKKTETLLKDDSHYIENIFVNLLISKVYPFNIEFNSKDSFAKKIDLMDNYIVFAWAYISFKVMLTGALTLEKELDLDTLFYTTVLHNREVIGSNNMLREMCSILKNLNFSSITQLSILIKNS